MATKVKKKLLLADGCSWTAGDIVDPKLFPDQPWHVNHPDNAQYRLPRVWPHKLGNLLNYETLNISKAGSSNDGIVRRILNKLPSILKQYKSSQIIAIIGWTSPERKDFFWKDGEEDIRAWETMYPSQLENNALNHKDKKKFYDLYGRYFWNEEEYITRYITQVITLHSVFKANNIKHYFFDAFYESTEAVLDPDRHAVFESINLNKFIHSLHKHFIKQGGYLSEMNIGGLFETYFDLYDNLFIKKTMIERMKEELPPELAKDHDARLHLFDETYHPTELSHNLWAEYLNKQIKNV